MAFTGVAVLKTVADNVVRITGLSLAAGAAGTIGLFGGAAEIDLPDDFNPKPYRTVALVDSLDLSVKEATASVPAAGAVGAASQFYGLTAGTGNGGANDYAATVAVNAAVPFPRVGPATAGAGIVAGGTNQFVLPVTGIYKVSWAVDFLEASQLVLKLGAVEQAHTTTTSGAGTQQNTNTVLISAVANDLLSLCNASGNAAALTVQTADGSLTHAQAANLIIEQVSSAAAGSGPVDIGVTKAASPFSFTVTNNDPLAPTAALEMYVRFHT